MEEVGQKAFEKRLKYKQLLQQPGLDATKVAKYREKLQYYAT